jgi:hypothetical protein
MSSSNTNLEQIKGVYDNNYYLLQKLDNGKEQSAPKGCFQNIIQTQPHANCDKSNMYWTLKNQNESLNYIIGSQLNSTNNINNRKLDYQSVQINYLMNVNYILFILYYVIAVCFLIYLIYHVFFSTSSKINLDFIKKFLYNYLLIILIILFYPFFIRPITLFIYNIFKYIFSILTSDIYISEKY